MSFERKPYDKFVANKVIEGTQFTIDWYVDDNTLLHKNPEVISDIINEVRKHFVKISVVRGNKHTFMGINIEIKYSAIQFDVVEQLE